MERIKPRRFAAVAAGLALAGLLAASAWAASTAGQLDTSFGGTGYVTTSFTGDYSFANGVTVQDGGKVVAVGGVATGSTGDFAIARYNKDGSLDQSFGNGGRVTTDFNNGTDLATAVAVQGDKIVVVGYTSPGDNTYYFALARYKKDGSLDSSFGNGGKVVSNFSGYDFADAVAVDGDKIVVAGETRAGTGGDNFAVARYNKNGSLDASFGTDGLVWTDFNGGLDSANGVALMGDKIVAGGYVQGANYDFGLVRYNKNGSLDSSFGTGGKVETDFGHGDDFGHAIDVKGDRIVLVGSASNGTDQDFAAAEYDKRGVLDPHFNGTGMSTMSLGGDDEASGGGFGPGDTVVAAGYSPGFTGGFAVARWTKSGAPDTSFGAGGFTTTPIGGASGGFAMALEPDNRIVVAGYSDDNFAVARYLDK
jgi:uncharacterized delta-60 repeat protein